MRRMSFSMTEDAIRDRTKFVTRRLGWRNLKRGDRILGVRKCMGLRKGEKQVPIAEIEIVSVRQEPLSRITREDVYREGFPGWSKAAFISRFCKAMGCTPDTEVTRIEFRYPDSNLRTEGSE